MILSMKRVPNMITLTRMVLSCYLNIYIMKYYGNILIPSLLFITIFMTDYMDGRVARFYNKTSTSGAIFDVVADVFYMVITYSLLWHLGILPIDFLVIVLYKFLEFLATSLILRKASKIRTAFVFDSIGKFIAVLFYIIPLLAYVSFNLFSSVHFFIIDIFMYLLIALVIISSSYRLWCCVKKVFI